MVSLVILLEIVSLGHPFLEMDISLIDSLQTNLQNDSLMPKITDLAHLNSELITDLVTIFNSGTTHLIGKIIKAGITLLTNHLNNNNTPDHQPLLVTLQDIQMTIQTRPMTTLTLQDLMTI